jgi:hypothetical protein
MPAYALLAALGEELLGGCRHPGGLVLLELEALGTSRPLPLTTLRAVLRFEAALLAAPGAPALGTERQLGEKLCRYHYWQVRCWAVRWIRVL